MSVWIDQPDKSGRWESDRFLLSDSKGYSAYIYNAETGRAWMEDVPSSILSPRAVAEFSLWRFLGELAREEESSVDAAVRYAVERSGETGVHAEALEDIVRAAILRALEIKGERLQKVYDEDGYGHWSDIDGQMIIDQAISEHF